MGHIMKALGSGVLSTTLLVGCAGAPSLHRAMIQYDDSVVEAVKEILLLNIARIHDEQPPHFTTVSDVKASFSFESTASFNPTFFSGGTTYNFTLGARVAESPTITLAPSQGEEFTKRFLKPIEFSAFNTLLLQGAGPLEMLLRLMADSFQQEADLECNPKEHEATLYRNRPTVKQYAANNKTPYDEFRQRVSHLETLRQAGLLSFENLTRDEDVEGTERHERPDQLKDLIEVHEKDYRWRQKELGGKKMWVLSKRITEGNPLILNFPGEELTDEDKKCIAEENKAHPYRQSLVLVYIKPNEPGGSFPFRGHFRLRNLHEILRFVAQGIRESDNEEYQVPPHEKTTKVQGRRYKSPDRTLTIWKGPVTGETSQVVTYKGEHFWVPSAADPDLQPSRWDQRAFALLYLILQMNLAEPKVTPPVVTVGGR